MNLKIPANHNWYLQRRCRRCGGRGVGVLAQGKSYVASLRADDVVHSKPLLRKGQAVERSRSGRKNVSTDSNGE